MIKTRLFDSTEKLNKWIERKTEVNPGFIINSISYQAVSPANGMIKDRILISYHVVKNEYGVYQDID